MGTKIEVPEIGAMKEQINETKKSIADSQKMLTESKKGVKAYLHGLNYTVPNPEVMKTISALEVHKWLVVKEKAIFVCLNQMRVRQGTFIGFFWAPFEDQGEIARGLEDFQTTEFKAYRNEGEEDIGNTLNPPTYFKSNEVTAPFQMITNMYGVPTYMEANPAPFAIITFPFFFGMMFGDYGHGSLIFFAGLMLTLFANQLKGTGAEVLLPGRYFMLAMGMCSMYNGLLYNEFFAVPNDWFGTCYNNTIRNETGNLDNANNFVYPPVLPIYTADVGETDPLNIARSGSHMDFIWQPINNTDGTPSTPPADAKPYQQYSSNYKGMDCVYPFGTDPTWYLDPNALTFFNSIKMRTSVIIGVFHMSMGITVKGLNAAFRGQRIVFIFEVIGGLLILNGLFGNMDYLVIQKWIYSMNAYSTNQDDVNRIHYCPAIISVMINNLMAFGSQKSLGWYSEPEGVYFYTGQRYTALICLMLVAISVPLMLCVKPCAYAFCCKPHEAHHENDFDEIQPAEPGAEDNQDLIDTGDKMGGDLEVDDVKMYEKILNAETGISEEHDYSFGGLFIHQMIETIEFVLGSVSNTASYLRLWALSLAHSQLGAVFIEQGLSKAWTPDKYGDSPSLIMAIIGSFVLWFPFWAVTMAVLMMMDVMECALHTVRLHWVEFQNKFFQGQGYVYSPFTFKTHQATAAK